MIHYSLKTSDTKTKGMGVQGKYWQQMKTVIYGNMTEQVSKIKQHGCRTSDQLNEDIEE